MMNLIKFEINEEYLELLKKEGNIDEFLKYHESLISKFFQLINPNSSNNLKGLDELFEFENNSITDIKN